jgi:uncharacterized protein YrrD
MKFADVVRRQVIDLETAVVMGVVDDAIVQVVTDGAARILGFTLRKTHGKNDWLDWADITAIGADAITVESVRALTEQPEDNGRLLLGDDVVGGRVLGDDGQSMSTISQIEFDPASGDITQVILANTDVHAGTDLRGVGRYATILRH